MKLEHYMTDRSIFILNLQACLVKMYLVKESWDSQEPGFRDGVILVSVPVDRFYSGVVQLEEGQPLFGNFAPRKKGEDPEKIEADMGDILEDEDPLSMFAQKSGRAGGRVAPQRDETLYEL